MIGIPYVTDCVIAELEKLGQKYRIALSILKDPRFERLVCSHKGTYADDCIVQRITQVYTFRYTDFFVSRLMTKHNRYFQSSLVAHNACWKLLLFYYDIDTQDVSK